MKRCVPLILVSPFIIITFYWLVEKYIHLLFNVTDPFASSIVSMMLTLIVSFATFGIIVDQVKK